MAEPKITGAMRIMDGSTNLRTLKELNTQVNNNTSDISNISNNVANIMNLSASPKKVGTWIDGKPLYEFVASAIDLSTSTRVKWDTFSNYGINNVKFAFLYEGFTRYPGNDFTYPLHSAGCTVQINGSADDIRFINDNGQGRNQDIYAIIRFTKTTD